MLDVASHASVLLLVEAITQTFPARAGQPPALAEVNFSVAEGAFVSLVGPSGCGKSTILSLIAGLLAPSSGRILLGGSMIRKPGADRGMVFQQANLFPWLTVFENVTFGLTLKANRVLKAGARGASSAALADSLLEAVGLAASRNHYPRHLSGGMRQRAALVRAFVTQPRILLMDEPFGALDAQTREEMQELLLHVCQARRMTVLFVTHDVEEAVLLSDRVLVMQANPGRIIADVSVPLPRPRNLTQRGDPTFTQLRAHLLDLLHHRQRTAVAESVLT